MKSTFILMSLLVALGCSDPGTGVTQRSRDYSFSGASVAIGLSDKSHTVNDDYYGKHVNRLLPAIAFVENYLLDHGELPSQKTFQIWADQSGAHMLIIWDREHEYAALHGATTNTDYLVGTWMSDWYFYYKSWGQSFINASDDHDTGYSY